MANIEQSAGKSRWRQFRGTTAYQHSRLFAKRVIGTELWLRPQVNCRLRGYGDAWAICPDLLPQQALVYSMGVGENIAFERALISEFGATVHAFDPTPNTASWLSKCSLPGNFHFHALALAGRDDNLMLYPRVKRNGSRSATMYTLAADQKAVAHGISVPGRTLSSVMAMLGHDSVDLVKMDIEGAEYAVLEEILAGHIRPPQLLVEFHHRFPGIGKARTAEIVHRLHAERYRISFVSPTGREVSFLRV